MRTFDSIAAIEKDLKKTIPLEKNYKQVYTLDNMLRLAELLGNPQEQFKAIHVAGTSGKTSTSYFIARLLRESGAKVGLTVSPHITDVRERAQVNSELLPEDEYCKYYSEFIQLIDSFNIEPTYFEILVAFSYWIFAKLKVDYAVVEVGMGGTLDGTNIIDRADKVSVITDIGFDHVQVLGTTLPEIAANKAGIIKPGNEVFVHEQGFEVMEVIEAAIAKSKNAVLHRIAAAELNELDAAAEHLPAYQRRNWHLATAVYDFVRERDSLPRISKKHLSSAANTVIPGRMETFRIGGKVVVVDGAHNPQKLSALFASLQETYPGQQIATLFAMLRAGKEKFDGNLGIIMKDCAEVIVTGIEVTQDIHRHGSDPTKIAAALEGHVPVSVIKQPKHALEALLSRPEPVLLITGSFYLVTIVRPMLVAKAAHK